MSAPVRVGPYKGLDPYDEQDAAFFVGRDRDVRVIAANLRSSRVTLLYGASGVGKTSVLRAGVVYQLRESARNAAEPDFAVAVFRDWSRGGDPARSVLDGVHASISELFDDVAPAEPTELLSQALQRWSKRVRLLIVLDQFEEFFRYYDGDEFDVELARAINSRDTRANFLISIREDELAKLDRFQELIPRLFDNYLLRIEHLDGRAAREAIVEPLRAWKPPNGEDGAGYDIEPELVDQVVKEVHAGKIRVGVRGHGVERGNGDDAHPDGGRVEAAYLQLVMEQLWDAELANGSRMLRLATFENLGRAQGIVESYLDRTLESLTFADRSLAAAVFDRLVTPSGTKIAQSLADLAEWSDTPTARLAPLLSRLEPARVVRRLPPPPGEPTGRDEARYEIFHDVLAAPLLEWRAQHIQAEDRRKRIRRYWKIGIPAVLVFLAVAALAFVANTKRNDANRAKDAAVRAQRHASLLAMTATADDQLHTPLGTSLLLSLAADQTSPGVEARRSAVLALQSAAAQPVRVIFRPHTPVSRVAAAPDGKTIASADDFGHIRLWDAQARRPLGPALLTAAGKLPDASRAPGLAFSPDGRTIAAGGETAQHSGTVRLWNVATRQLVMPRFRDPADPMSGSIRSVAFSPNGRILATAGYDSTVRLWNLGSHEVEAHLKGHTQPIQALAFSPDGTVLASGGDDATIRLWDVRTGRALGQPLHSRSGSVLTPAFSRAGTLASAGRDGRIELWDVRRHAPLGLPLGQSGPTIRSIAFSRDGRMLASGADDGSIRFWDIRTRRAIPTPIGRALGEVQSLVFTPAGELVSGSADRQLTVWDASLQKVAGQPLSPRSSKPVRAVAVSPDGKLLVSGGFDGTIRVWEPGRARFLSSAHLGGGSIFALAYAPDGKTFASSEGSTVRLWRAGATPTPLELDTPLHAAGGKVRSLAFSRNRLLAAGDTDGTVRLWDVTRPTSPRLLGAPLTATERKSTVPLRLVYAVAFSPDAKTLAAGGQDGRMRLWDVTDAVRPRALGLLHGPQGSVRSIAFSPDGRIVAIGASDNTIWFWDAKTLKPLGHTPSGSEAVESVAFAPTGEILVSGGDDATIRFWDVATHRPLGEPLRGHLGPIRSIALSPDAAVLASAGDDGTVRLWNGVVWNRGGLVPRVCNLVVGGVTRSEWKAIVPDSAYHAVCRR